MVTMEAKGNALQSSDYVFFDQGESFAAFYPRPENRIEGSDEYLKALGLQALESARASRSLSLVGNGYHGGIVEEGVFTEAVAKADDHLLLRKDEDPDTKSDAATCHVNPLPDGEDSEENDYYSFDDEDLSVLGEECVTEKLRLLADMAGVDDSQPTDVLLAEVITVLKDLEEKSWLCGFPYDEELESVLG